MPQFVSGNIVWIYFFVIGLIQAEVAPLEDGSGFYCLTCGSRFRSKPSAQRHFREIHSLLHQSQEVCPYCSKVYKAKRHLASHLRTSHGVRSSGKIFLWPQNSSKKKLEIKMTSSIKWFQVCGLWCLKIQNSRNVWSATLKQPGTKCRGISKRFIRWGFSYINVPHVINHLRESTSTKNIRSSVRDHHHRRRVVFFPCPLPWPQHQRPNSRNLPLLLHLGLECPSH